MNSCVDTSIMQLLISIQYLVCDSTTLALSLRFTQDFTPGHLILKAIS